MALLRSGYRLCLPVALCAAALLPSTALATPAASAWKTYRNTQAGFAINYPKGWTAHLRRQVGSNLDVALLPPGSSSGVDVSVRPPLPRYTTEPSDTPNTYCHDVTAHGITGTSCRTTTSGTILTTFETQYKVYRVAASLRQIRGSVYGSMVRSFRLLR